MGDYIDRKVALIRFSFENGNRIPEKDIDGFPNTVSFRDVKAVLRSLPAANVREDVHGKWLHDHTDPAGGNFAVVRCSVCGYKAYAIAEHIRNGNFCPKCGARMDGD